MIRMILSIIVLLQIAGCQTGSLYFATDTSISLVNLSGDGKLPDKLTLGFSRTEALIVPEEGISSSHNKLQSILGTINSDLTWFRGVKIDEVYATGVAANCAAYRIALKKMPKDIDGGAKEVLKTLGFKEDVLCPSTNNANTGNDEIWKVPDRRSLVFEAKTKFSILDFSFGETEAPNTTLFGFNQRVGSIIPLLDKEAKVRSVYSHYCFNSMDKVDDKRTTSIQHAYATGLAAIMVATLGIPGNLNTTPCMIPENEEVINNENT